jgi:hypothetical protein
MPSLRRVTAPVSAVRIFRILGPVFAGVGGLLASIALVLAVIRAIFLLGASQTEGQVIDVQAGLPSVQIVLPTGARTVRGSISSEPPSLMVGERVPVYFRADGGGDAIIGSFLELWFIPVLLMAIAIPFAAIGTGSVLFVARRDRRDRELRANGRKLEAKVVAVEPSVLRINRRPAKVLVATAQDKAGQTLTFRSDAMLLEDSAWLGKAVTVYVDPRDPGRYSMQFEE